MAQHQEALAGSREVLEQAAEVLRRMDDATYAEGGAAPGVSPIGAHFRHVLDHYRALVDGLAGGRIDYEARHRRGPIERERALALAEVLRLREALDRVAETPEDRELLVNLQSVADPDAGPDWSRSTAKRELQFLVSHTVHHFALIRPLLSQAGVDPGQTFGVAPSTVSARLREANGAGDLATRR
jgi:uncharacterized damage-inducible protein DinB